MAQCPCLICRSSTVNVKYLAEKNSSEETQICFEDISEPDHAPVSFLSIGFSGRPRM
jgi:hypothetical protein